MDCRRVLDHSALLHSKQNYLLHNNVLLLSIDNLISSRVPSCHSRRDTGTNDFKEVSNARDIAMCDFHSST